MDPDPPDLHARPGPPASPERRRPPDAPGCPGPPDPSVVPDRDRFRGALLGTLVGDALGMPVEGWSAARIARELGEVREMFPARCGRGTYTDDTQMAGALARALLDAEDPSAPDPERVAFRFAEAFDADRGYGGNTRRLLSSIRSGTPWRVAADRHRLPGGSFANGAAMRVAPVALACFPDAAATARASDLQARVTAHDHPEGRFGARLQAAGVLLCLTGSPADPAPDPHRILRAASDGWVGEVPEGYRIRLEWILRRLETRDARAPVVPLPAPAAAARALGTGVRAVEAVPAALWAFLTAPDDPERALVNAIALGGDTDTIAAMTGALVGARCGAARFPARWVEALEEGPEGRSALLELADRLHRRCSPPEGTAAPGDPPPTERSHHE